MKYKLLLIMLGLQGLGELYAQNFPQDWGNYTNLLDRAGQSQSSGVNEFTGSINYSFNFYPLVVDGQSFPISIGYSSNGVKVDEYASSVGLGWNLSAGGSITKITRGLDDMEPGKGYHVISGSLITPENIYNGIADGEKDYYVFSAFGFGGTFYYDETTATYKPLAGEKISIEWQPTPQVFIIRDDAGNAYHFTLRETIYTYSGTLSNLVNTQQGNWFLTKVVLASKKEITLAYTAKNITGLKVSFNEVSSIAYGSCNVQPNHIGSFIYNTYNSYKIQSITSGNTTIEFSYKSTARQDITDDYALEKIDVKLNNTNYKAYILQQSYHNSRLMLNGINEWIIASGTAQSLLELEYYKDYTMPAPVSVQSQDWMGYFNNQAAYTTTYYSPNFKTLVSPYQTPGTTGSAGIEPGANREIATADVVQTLMLKKAVNLYGKTEEFTYEANKYNVVGANQNGPTNTETLTHGVRVAEVTSYEQTQPSKKKYIKYIYLDNNNVSTGLLTTLTAAPTVFGLGCTRIIRMPYIRKTRAQVADAMVVYRHVKTQVYTNPADQTNSTLGYTINSYSIDSPGYENDTWGGVSTPRPIFYANKCMWGKLTSSKSYSRTMQLVSWVDYIYESASTRKYFGTYVWLGKKMADGSNDAAAHYYYTHVGYNRLKYTVKYSYSPDAQLMVTNKQVLTYDNAGYVSEIKSYINTVLTNRTTYKHPYDYSVTGIANHPNGKAIYQMNQQKIAAPVIESISYKVAGTTETVISAGINLQKYDDGLQMILADKTLTYKQVSPQATVTALSFDASGAPSYPDSYRIVSETRKFDDQQYPVEVVANDVECTALHYNENGNLLCTFSNTLFDATGFMGFEPYEIAKLSNYSTINANWYITGSAYTYALVNTAYTGTAAINLSLCMWAPAIEFTKVLQAGKRYILRYWQKTGSGNVILSLNNTEITSTQKVLKNLTDWQLIEREIETDPFGLSTFSLAGTAIIDDIVFYPLGSAYQYQVYNNKEMKTAGCDASGTCIFYEYDNQYRTLYIKDQSNNVLKAFEYGIKEQQ
jgi:hypothetical protein